MLFGNVYRLSIDNIRNVFMQLIFSLTQEISRLARRVEGITSENSALHSRIIQLEDIADSQVGR